MTNITANRYNSLVDRIRRTLGEGTSTYGYGQIPAAEKITADVNIVTDEQMRNLFNDMFAMHNHQQGPNVPLDAIGFIFEDDIALEDDPVDKKGIVQYEQFMDTLEDNRLLVDFASQISVEGTTASNGTNIAWTDELTHEFSVQFLSPNHRRHFFNAGGEIYFTAGLTGGSGAATEDWRALLSGVGQVKFNYNRTTSTALPDPRITATSIGNYQLNTEYQTVFDRTASGTYTDNTYKIEAKSISASGIQFRITFDNTAGEVDGELQSIVELARPDSDQVRLPAPTTTLIRNLSSNARIDELRWDPAVGELRDSFKLVWQTSFADRVVYEITGPDGTNISQETVNVDGNSGDLDFDVQGTYTGTITAFGDGLSATQTVNLPVSAIPLPVIDTFSWSPATGTTGQIYTLNWTITDADTVTYSVTGPELLADDLSGELDDFFIAEITQAGSYVATITATNEGGSVSETVSLTVAQAPAPVISNLQWSPSTGFAGDTFKLTWNITNFETASYSIAGAGGQLVTNVPISQGDTESATVILPVFGSYTGTVTATGIGGTTTESVTIQVGVAPTYTIVFDNDTQKNETDDKQINLVINTTGVANGTVLYWDIASETGTVNTADFTTATSGTVSINTGTGAVSLTIREDELQEGLESFRFNVRTSPSADPETSVTFFIYDTSESLPDPVYEIDRIIPTIINETDSRGFSVDISTENVPNGTTLYYTISGPNITSADFDTSLSGSFTVNNNRATVSGTVSTDNLTEGRETATFSVRTGSTLGPDVASKTFTIQDTSTTPIPDYTVNVSASSPNTLDRALGVTQLGYGSSSLFGRQDAAPQDFATITVDAAQGSGEFTLEIDATNNFIYHVDGDSGVKGSVNKTYTQTSGARDRIQLRIDPRYAGHGSHTINYRIRTANETVRNTITATVTTTQAQFDTITNKPTRGGSTPAGGSQFFHNTFAVWESDVLAPNFDRTYNVFLPYAGEYIARLSVDDIAEVTLEDAAGNLQASAINGQTGTFLLPRGFLNRFTVAEPGYARLKVRAQNVGVRTPTNPGGFACLIRTSPCQNPPDVTTNNPPAIYYKDGGHQFVNGAVSWPLNILKEPLDARGRTIQRWYNQYLNRQPEQEGFEYWYNDIEKFGEATAEGSFRRASEEERANNGGIQFEYLSFCDFVTRL